MFTWPLGLFDQATHQLLQPRAAQRFHQVRRAAGIGGDKRQVYLGFKHAGEVNLGTFRRIPQALEGHPVFAQVNPALLEELLDQPFQYFLVEVVATQVGVAVGGLHLEDAVAQLEDANVEGTPAQVEDGNGSVSLCLVHTIGQRRGRGFVDDAQHLQPGDGAGVLGGLSLGIVEVGRDGNHGLGDGFAQFGFGVLLDLLQDEGGDLGGRMGLARHLHVGISTGPLDYLVG